MEFWWEGPIGAWHADIYNDHIKGTKAVDAHVGGVYIELRFPTPQNGLLVFYVENNSTVWLDGAPHNVTAPYNEWTLHTFPVENLLTVRWLSHDSSLDGVDGVIVV
jgi:hypothetical protein